MPTRDELELKKLDLEAQRLEIELQKLRKPDGILAKLATNLPIITGITALVISLAGIALTFVTSLGQREDAKAEKERQRGILFRENLEKATDKDAPPSRRVGFIWALGA